MEKSKGQEVNGPRVVVASRDEWLAARRQLLEKEKELTRQRDRVNEERRHLPWVAVQTPYVFEGAQGRQSLGDLFAGKSQLVVYHFMFSPDWDEGCKSCSMVVDSVDQAVVHLAARDVSLVAVSRAPHAKIDAFKRRMGWQIPWVSSGDGTFNFDFGVSFTQDQIVDGRVPYNFGTMPFRGDEAHGLSVFARDEAGTIFHTYSAYARGLEPMLAPYGFLDLVPRGRDEAALPYSMAWIHHHDRYDQAPAPRLFAITPGGSR